MKAPLVLIYLLFFCWQVKLLDEVKVVFCSLVFCFSSVDKVKVASEDLCIAALGCWSTLLGWATRMSASLATDTLYCGKKWYQKTGQAQGHFGGCGRLCLSACTLNDQHWSTPLGEDTRMSGSVLIIAINISIGNKVKDTSKGMSWPLLIVYINTAQKEQLTP